MSILSELRLSSRRQNPSSRQVRMLPMKKIGSNRFRRNVGNAERRTPFAVLDPSSRRCGYTLESLSPRAMNNRRTCIARSGRLFVQIRDRLVNVDTTGTACESGSRSESEWDCLFRFIVKPRESRPILRSESWFKLFQLKRTKTIYIYILFLENNFKILNFLNNSIFVIFRLSGRKKFLANNCSGVFFDELDLYRDLHEFRNYLLSAARTPIFCTRLLCECRFRREDRRNSTHTQLAPPEN